MELGEPGDGRRRRDVEIASDDADRGVVRARLIRDADAVYFTDRDEAPRDLELLHVALRERLVESHDRPRVARRDREIPVLELRVGSIRRYTGVTDALVAYGEPIRALETHCHEPVEDERVGVRRSEERRVGKEWRSGRSEYHDREVK